MKKNIFIDIFVDWQQGDQMIWKKSPNFLKSSQTKLMPN